MRKRQREPTTQSARELLAEAGIPVTEVDLCDDTNCNWCDPEPLQLAA